jgi:hypothetical protein
VALRSARADPKIDRNEVDLAQKPYQAKEKGQHGGDEQEGTGIAASRRKDALRNKTYESKQ